MKHENKIIRPRQKKRKCLCGPAAAMAPLGYRTGSAVCRFLPQLSRAAGRQQEGAWLRRDSVPVTPRRKETASLNPPITDQ